MHQSTMRRIGSTLIATSLLLACGGGGILVASVGDPIGNTLHLIQNPHFDPRAVH